MAATAAVARAGQAIYPAVVGLPFDREAEEAAWIEAGDRIFEAINSHRSALQAYRVAFLATGRTWLSREQRSAKCKKIKAAFQAFDAYRAQCDALAIARIETMEGLRAFSDYIQECAYSEGINAERPLSSWDLAEAMVNVHHSLTALMSGKTPSRLHREDGVLVCGEAA